jgi:hypothetical protein
MDGPASNLFGTGASVLMNHRSQEDAPVPASKWLHSYLKKQMLLSKRRGGWFRLEKRERSMFSLALRLNASFKGYQLLKAMVSILKKLRAASDRVYGRLLKGLQVAWAFSTFAVEWGNPRAKEWRNDLEYSKYLGSHMCSEGKFY